MTDFIVEQVSWQARENEIRSIRTRVFIVEQNVPEELEWDENDIACIHLLVIMNEQPVATARLLDTGQIGRMAVDKAFRRQGIGSTMLKQLLKIAIEKGMDSVFLNSQLDAVDFYKGFGFYEQGELFNDAGILHRRMRKELE